MLAASMAESINHRSRVCLSVHFSGINVVHLLFSNIGAVFMAYAPTHSPGRNTSGGRGQHVFQETMCLIVMVQ